MACQAGAIVLLLSLAVSAPASKPASAPPPAAEAPQAAPAGFVEAKVIGLAPTGEGTAVVLSVEAEGLLLPIWIGEAEAFSIQLRLERRRFQRPLTHDLLDDVVRQLGGRLLKVQVDDLKGNTFVGTVFLKQGVRQLEIDSRPSDAIALAIGNRVPIFVSRAVLQRAGVPAEKPAQPGTAPAPAAPENLLRDILDSDREEHTL